MVKLGHKPSYFGTWLLNNLLVKKMIVNEIHPFLQNMYRKRREDQYINNGIKGKHNKKNREIVIGEPGSNRFGVINVLIKRDGRDH